MPERTTRVCLALLVLMLSASASDARCTEWHQVMRFARSVDASLDCAARQLGSRTSSCREIAPPACAAEPARAIVELASGSALRGRHRDERELSCQSAIVSAARSYVARRIQERRARQRGASRNPALRRVTRACDGVPVRALPGGGRIPGLGGACAALYDAQSGPDAYTLGRCLVAALEGSIDAALPHPIRPNLVLILTDDQRADSLAYMPITNDRLAERGVRFDDGFATTPVCGPSRASILSGLYASHHGILTNQGLALAAHDFDEDRTVARWLQSVGYRTGFFGKYVNGYQLRPPYTPLGWDDWQVFLGARYFDYALDVNGEIQEFGADAADYSTDVLATRAARFVDENREQPFLLVLAVFAPHLPATPAPRHAGAFSDLEPARPPSFHEPDLTGKPPWVHLARSASEPAEAVDALRASQLETLLAVDEAVAKVLDAIDRHGLTDETAVFFLSDNGYHWGEHW